MLKSEHIKFRVTKVERITIETYAKANGITISKALRQLINKLQEDLRNESK
ncbi:hypothetical protein [Romboutsia sp.]|uniref:hypothetical protein n=1 Tax=Romboutsia sp. TaxID=1965302 RepID=UPI002B74E7E1|nr:hypothetical protein [Romboutsia sp.]HSQ89459.1 hypothetical protein [Romboutsia sp.]